MKKIILSIEGMTCSACSSGLEKYLKKQNGIIDANVNLVMSNASIEYDESILKVADLNNFVQNAGFKSLGEFNDIKLNNNNKNKILFIIFTLLSILFVYVMLSNLFGLPILNILNKNTNPISYTSFLFIFSILYILYGIDILKNGYKNLIHASPNMDTLVSIGVLCSFGYSIYNMILLFMGNNNIVNQLYFESVIMVIYFVKLGRFIDSISKNKTKEAIKKLVTITPKEAIILFEGKEKKVSIDEIKVDDIVVSKPGERIAVDGNIIKGTVHIDESFLTGESMPVTKKKGDMIIAGSINLDSYIEYKAKKIGKNSTISEIVKLVVEASNTKTPISKLVDKISSYFVPTIIIIAIITFLIYLVLGFTFNKAIITFVTILVVACPCSLGLATPLALVISLGKCANHGILIKNSEVLELLSKIDTIVFDKTGTLTYGTLKIENIINYSNKTNDEILQIIGSIENKSNHPIASAFKSYLDEKNIEKLTVNNFKSLDGLGVIGTIKNKKYIIGNLKLLKKYNIDLTTQKNIENSTATIIYLANNNKVLATIEVNDIIRKNISNVINKIKEINIEPIMLTGDNQKIANTVADKINIDKVISNVLPSEKLNIIKKLKQNKKTVMMCGDGINDSPALTSSDIGVSIKSATDIAIDSSDVILINNDLYDIIEMINISKKTNKIIKQNLFWAFLYNTLMILIATGIFNFAGISITPMIASIAMTISSLTVVLNTLRLK